MAVADFDADGNLDLAVADPFDANGLAVLLGDGAGGFATPPLPYLLTYSTARGPRKVALGDYNGDGFLDIATADSGDYSSGDPAFRDNRTTVLLNSGSGGLTAAAGSPFTTVLKRRFTARHFATAAFHAPGSSERTFSRALTSSPRLVSCVDVVESADGYCRCRCDIHRWTSDGSRPKRIGLAPTSFNDKRRLYT